MRLDLASRQERIAIARRSVEGVRSVCAVNALILSLGPGQLPLRLTLDLLAQQL